MEEQLCNLLPCLIYTLRYGYPCYRISTLNSIMQACAHMHNFQSFPAASSQQQYQHVGLVKLYL